MVVRSGPASHACILRLDKVKQHAKSKMHRLALLAEPCPLVRLLVTLIALRSGLQLVVALLVVQARKCPHNNLLKLAQSLGCDYFKALNVGCNATYTSPQIVGEFLEVSDGIVLEEVYTARHAGKLHFQHNGG